MKLYLMRHGIAEEVGAVPGCPDGERRLTPEGVQRTREVVAGARRLGVGFDQLLASPMARSLETAAIVADVFEWRGETRIIPNLAANIRHGPMLQSLMEALDGVDAALVVGHEPGLSQMTSVLLTGGISLTTDFRKASLCLISFAAGIKTNEGVLEWFLPPKVLRKIG